PSQYRSVFVLLFVQIIFRDLLILGFVKRLALVVGLWGAVCPRVLYRLSLVIGHINLGNTVFDWRTVRQMDANGTLRVINTVSDGDNGEDHQRADLDDIDRHIYRRGPIHPPVGDIRDTEGEEYTKQYH